ncbi:hypothetical protein LTR84_007072 [Exophiala bonariae]|uniref:WSC domain-containing protein n=1 Tax=Exophiala bonariae TaxID=1690606 RepID=A0AAV9N2Y7_9EURO|nr:hypothetical protein LTR84_007072 [Exophiala bonariae]
MRAQSWAYGLIAFSGAFASKLESPNDGSCAIVVTESYGQPVWNPTAALPEQSIFWSAWTPAAHGSSILKTKTSATASGKPSSTKTPTASTTGFSGWSGHQGNSGMDPSKIASYREVWSSRQAHNLKTSTSSAGIGQQPWSDWYQSTKPSVTTTTSSSGTGWQWQTKSSIISSHASYTRSQGRTSSISSTTAAHFSSTGPHSWHSSPVSPTSPSSTRSSGVSSSSSATSYSWPHTTIVSSTRLSTTSTPPSTSSSGTTTSTITSETTSSTSTSSETTTTASTTTSDATTSTTTSATTTSTTTSDTTTSTTTSDTTTSTTTTTTTTETTTTTTTTTATTTTTTAPPTPSSCNIEGYNSGAPVEDFYDSSTPVSYAECRQYCTVNHPDTVSVGFGLDFGTTYSCACYNSPVDDYVTRGSTGYFFSDVTCPVSDDSTTSTI